MALPQGYNPLRWDCEEKGCFNKKRRPKIEVFAGALPGNIAFGDVDAVVEIKGHFLFLEFKSDRILTTGQRILAQQLTKLSPKVIYAVICCDSETMVTTGVLIIRKGNIGNWEECDLKSLYKRIESWANTAKSRSHVRVVK